MIGWREILSKNPEVYIFSAELHVHTVLSPCADVTMIPPLIVESALTHGIQLLAITDHNATGNILSVIQAAEGTDLKILPGMELQTKEDIHTLCLFDSMDQAMELQKMVDAALPPMDNDPDHFGEQFLVDSTGDFLASDPRLLLTSTNITLDQACHIVHSLDGLFIPAHVNRKVYGLIPTLGFVPEELDVDALEISRHLQPSEIAKKLPQIENFPIIQSGDVHRLDEFMGIMHFSLNSRSIAEIKMAFQHACGRDFKIG